MDVNGFSYFSSHRQFLRSYKVLESLYIQYKDKGIPMNRADFSGAFFGCYDYLSSLSPEDVALLKSDIGLHCKIVMFDTIKLHIIAENPRLLQIPGLQRIF
ncbi:MAG TPA: hypothetical protein DDW78_06405 [Treponema sp.]|nr:hypothetical protein [Treponema sp.]